MNVECLNNILSIKDKDFKKIDYYDISLKYSILSINKKNVYCFKIKRDIFNIFMLYTIVNNNIGLSNLNLSLEYVIENQVICTFTEKQFNEVFA